VRDEFLVFGRPLVGDEEVAEILDTLASGWLGTGPKTKTFEARFAAYVRARHAVAVSSCTAALHLALNIIGVREGDEVITSPLTFPATANVVEHCRARPVFADVDRGTMTIDPDAVEAAITPRTRAIIPVHLAGRPCDMPRLLAIAERHNLVVVEDAAHAVEAAAGPLKIGSAGHMAAFSFYATKNLVTGEGGMLTTGRDDWAEAARVRSLHGISSDAWKRYGADGFTPYDTVYPGYKYNMTDMQASLGLHQLARIDASLAIRERHWSRYNQAFAPMPELVIPAEQDGIRHARHLYTLLIRPERLTIDRNGFIDELKRRRIGAGVHFTALHLHTYYRERYGYTAGAFPNAEWIGERTLSLPLSAALTDANVDDVIEAVRNTVETHRLRMMPAS
jgi:dTDP-4-amino-4,6-dideoxygalactose transaminase